MFARLVRRVVTGGVAAFGGAVLMACTQIMPGIDQAAPAKRTMEKSKPVRLHVVERGRGEPVLLLHGFGASSYSWRYIIPDLARKNKVYALDLKGFGKSDKPLDDKYSLFDQADLIEAWIRRKKLKKLTLIGHSFGGGVALALALRFKKSRPQLLKRLVLLDSIAYEQDVPFGLQLLGSPTFSRIGMALIPPEMQATLALKTAYYHDEEIPGGAAAEYAKPLYTMAGRHAIQRTAAQIIPKHMEKLTQQYKSLKIPTLLLWCEFDRTVPVGMGIRLWSELPDARFRLIKDCGHAPQEERPSETSRQISLFLQQR